MPTKRSQVFGSAKACRTCRIPNLRHCVLGSRKTHAYLVPFKLCVLDAEFRFGNSLHCEDLLFGGEKARIHRRVGEEEPKDDGNWRIISRVVAIQASVDSQKILIPPRMRNTYFHSAICGFSMCPTCHPVNVNQCEKGSRRATHAVCDEPTQYTCPSVERVPDESPEGDLVLGVPD